MKINLQRFVGVIVLADGAAAGANAFRVIRKACLYRLTKTANAKKAYRPVADF